MIQKIELWDWECFDHAVLDNLSSGLNLIFGESDSGKTSIVRALRLAAYNEFDPRSVRIGAKNVRVKVITDKGWVHVTRGKDNIWETCRNGEHPKEFKKIGKDILPEAAVILGLNMVQLGDMNLPVNIMDQDEGHFMLNELGGDSASGSMRAQIVDEISGLSGIEGLIKEVSLDKHRLGRSVKENEQKANELRESMYDEEMIEDEDKLLSEVAELVEKSDKNMALVNTAVELFEKHHNTSEDVKNLEKQFNMIPNTKILKALVGKAEKKFSKAKNISEIIKEYDDAKASAKKIRIEIKKLPDVSKAQSLLDSSVIAFNRIAKMNEFYKKHVVLSEQIDEIESGLKSLNVEALEKAVKVCDKAVSEYEKARDLAFTLDDELEEFETLEGRIDAAEKELAEAIKERDEALANVKVCPLTQKAVSGECLKSI